MRLRSERTRRARVIAVTGARNPLADALVTRLAGGSEASAGKVVVRGLDAPPYALEGVDVLVHLDVDRDCATAPEVRRARTVFGTSQVVDTALAVGVRRLVLVTSAEVYGPAPDPIPDHHPRTAEPDDASMLGDHAELERLAEHAHRCGMAVTVLRPATLVGGVYGRAYDGHQLRQLGGPRLLAVRGVEPAWQLCHADDLLSALELAAHEVVTGGLGVASEGALRQRKVEALAGKRRLELPAAVALSTAERLRRTGITSASPRELDYLLAPTVLECDGLRAAGWRPEWTNEAALRMHLLERAADQRTALPSTTVTAAGATAALVGTAALVRTARRRRGR